MKVPQINFTPKSHTKIGFEIMELSEIYKRSYIEKLSFVEKPHRIVFHNLLYITSGNGTHFIDFNHVKVKAGSVVFIKKNQIHAFDLINQPQGKLIIFTDDFIDMISSTMKTPLFAPHYFQTSTTPLLSLSGETQTTCDALLFEIVKEYQLAEPSLHFLSLLFSAVLNKLNSVWPQSSEVYLSEPRKEKYNQFMVLLESNYTLFRDAKYYAGLLHITYKSLNEICKLASNQTAKQLIDGHIILEAKRKLSIEDLRVQQLAHQLGFDEVTNFVIYFKKHTSFTPKHFKVSLI
jgi:AraC-like DNA-binding protein